MIAPLLRPTRPPTITAFSWLTEAVVPCTGPVANDPEIVPELKPANPPMEEPMSFGPLPAMPLTAFEELEFVIVPSLRPTRPPAKVLIPVVMMLPNALELTMLAPA